MKETTSLTWIQQRLRAREIKPEDNERYLSRWCLWGTPQFDTSVQHQDQSFSAPKICQFNTSNAFIQQTRQFSTKNRHFNTKNVSLAHKILQFNTKNLELLWLELTGVFNWRSFVLNWRFFELNGRICWTDALLCRTKGFWGRKKSGPFVLNWQVCWTEGDSFYVMIIMLKFKQLGYYSISTKSLVENDKLFNLNLKIFDEA